MTSQATAGQYNAAQKASKMAEIKRDFLLLFSQNIYRTKDQKTKQVVKMEPLLTAYFSGKGSFLHRSSPLKFYKIRYFSFNFEKRHSYKSLIRSKFIPYLHAFTRFHPAKVFDIPMFIDLLVYAKCQIK